MRLRREQQRIAARRDDHSLAIERDQSCIKRDGVMLAEEAKVFAALPGPRDHGAHREQRRRDLDHGISVPSIRFTKSAPNNFAGVNAPGLRGELRIVRTASSVERTVNW